MSSGAIWRRAFQTKQTANSRWEHAWWLWRDDAGGDSAMARAGRCTREVVDQSTCGLKGHCEDLSPTLPQMRCPLGGLHREKT